MAVTAHARHAETAYDTLLARGEDRGNAREHVADRVDEVLTRWKTAR